MDSNEEQSTNISKPPPAPAPPLERIADIINKLISDAKIFYSKAKAYREHEELCP